MRHDLDDPDEEKNAIGASRWREFECPDCNAHNPVDDGFTFGDEVLCCYCGTTFKVKESGSKYKLKEA